MNALVEKKVVTEKSPLPGTEFNALGLDYLYGRNGRKKDPVKAAAEFKKAADKKLSTGMWNLGIMIVNGEIHGTFEEGVRWIFKAALYQHDWAKAWVSAKYFEPFAKEDDPKLALTVENFNLCLGGVRAEIQAAKAAASRMTGKEITGAQKYELFYRDNGVLLKMQIAGFPAGPTQSG